MNNTVLSKLTKEYPELTPVLPQIWDAFSAIHDVFEDGGRLFAAGNGGSAADADHLVGELMKSFRPPAASGRGKRGALSGRRGTRRAAGRNAGGSAARVFALFSSGRFHGVCQRPGSGRGLCPTSVRLGTAGGSFPGVFHFRQCPGSLPGGDGRESAGHENPASDRGDRGRAGHHVRSVRPGARAGNFPGAGVASAGLSRAVRTP